MAHLPGCTVVWLSFYIVPLSPFPITHMRNSLSERVLSLFSAHTCLVRELKSPALPSPLQFPYTAAICHLPSPVCASKGARACSFRVHRRLVPPGCRCDSGLWASGWVGGAWRSQGLKIHLRRIGKGPSGKGQLWWEGRRTKCQGGEFSAWPEEGLLSYKKIVWVSSETGQGQTEKGPCQPLKYLPHARNYGECIPSLAPGHM